MKRVWRYLDERLPWITLATWLNSPLVRLTALIPVIGYLIIFSNALQPYFQLVSPLDSSSSGPSPTLVRIYFGLVFVGIAALIYQFGCHSKIKHYRDHTAFVGGDGPLVKHKVLMDYVDELKRSKFAKELERAQTDQQIQQDYDLKAHVLDMLFVKWNTAYPVARVLCAAFCLIGFLILGLQSVLIFAKVLLLSLGMLR